MIPLRNPRLFSVLMLLSKRICFKYPMLNPQMKNWKSDRRISTRQRNLLVLPDCAEITLFGILVIRH